MPAVPHAIRAVCRLRLLGRATRTRNDVEGIDEIDVHASSSKAYKKWRKSLAAGDIRLLQIFRGGAVRSATRTNSGQAPELCHLCGQPVYPSIRHLWAECDSTAELRASVGKTHGIPAAWWKRQPRVTSKTGWVVLSAAHSAERRGVLQVAACKLGIAILKNIEP